MSDSLRDQLLAAGFQQPKSQEPKGKKPKHQRGNQPKSSGAPKKTASVRSSQAVRSGNQAAQNAKQTSADKQTSVDEVQKRKAIKAQIKALIESNAIADFKGDTVYRFTLQNRIREIHVSTEIRQKLIDNELNITRLNGSTFIVPLTTAEQIRVLNPGWAIVQPRNSSTEVSEGYDDFPIPDDLIW